MKATSKQVKEFSGCRLAILMPYSDLCPQKVIMWIKRHIAKELETLRIALNVARNMPQCLNTSKR